MKLKILGVEFIGAHLLVGGIYLDHSYLVKTISEPLAQQ